MMQENQEPIHLAIDLGASGGRVLAGKLGTAGVELEEVHRFSNGGIEIGERLVWNIIGLWEQVVSGLNRAAAKYGDRIVSVGADTWGVDYVLLDRNDDLVGPCVHYRDKRTVGVVEKSFELLSRDKIFAATGLQFMEINSAYQLLAMRLEKSPQLDVAERFLMVPDFMHWQLSGEKVNEYTNASTTQLLDAKSGQWSDEVLQAFNIPRHLFSTPVQPGESLGTIRSSLQNLTKLPGKTQVIVPATHDTGSAVLAVPADSFRDEKPDWCYISCGTWSLMGAELASPVLTADCQRYNFTNEGGAEGSIRLLKNISGLWIVQQCREQWKRDGRELSWSALVKLAQEAPAMTAVIDPDASDFVAPENMPNAIRQYCQRTGQTVPQSDGALIRCALESLALRYRQVLGYLEQLVGHSLSTIHIVGGGVQNQLLCQFAADACQKRVVAGPAEATALGNVLVQAIGSGELASVSEARALVRSADGIIEFAPQPGLQWDIGFAKLQELTSSQ